MRNSEFGVDFMIDYFGEDKKHTLVSVGLRIQKMLSILVQMTQLLAIIVNLQTPHFTSDTSQVEYSRVV